MPRGLSKLVSLLLVLLPWAERMSQAQEKGPAIGTPTVVDAIVPSQASYDAWAYRFDNEDHTLLEAIQHGCFNYFWNEVGSPACLVRDKTSDSICSLAAVGFQLSSLPLGVEHGWVEKEQAEARAVTILRSLVERRDNKRHGIYFHFVDADSGGKPDFDKTQQNYELMASTIDHALFQAGVMTASVYFGGEVDRLGDRIISEADWAHFRHGEDQFLSMGWKATTGAGVDGPGKIWPWHWKRASDEERLIYWLAVGSPDPEKRVPPEDYYRLERSVEQYEDDAPYVVAWSGSLFMYFFSHCWIDYGALEPDQPATFGIAGPRVDWLENTRRAALTHRRRCQEQADRYPTLGPNRWGLAPCSKVGGGYCVQEVQPNLVDNDRWCEGIVAPYAAASVLPMLPRESLAALRTFRSLTDLAGKPLLWSDPAQGGYGLADSFRLDPPRASDVYLGIDQGPMLLAIENARTGIVWRLFGEHEVSQAAIQHLQLQPRKKPWTSDTD